MEYPTETTKPHRVNSSWICQQPLFIQVNVDERDALSTGLQRTYGQGIAQASNTTQQTKHELPYSCTFHSSLNYIYYKTHNFYIGDLTLTLFIV